GVVIGKRGCEMDKLRDGLRRRTGREDGSYALEPKRPDRAAQLVADPLAQQLTQRIPCRRARPRPVRRAFRPGRPVINIQAAGRPRRASDEGEAMLAPKRVKFRKRFKGRTKGMATRGNTVAFGHYGLMALEPGWISNRQIEASRVALTREMKRGGKVWIRLF